MKLALRRIKVYSKLGLMGAVALSILLTVYFNNDKKVDVWFFHTFRQINVLYLILVTAVGSVAVFWAFTRVRGVVREARELQKERRAAEALARQRKLAEELAERERRIDEKMRRSITEES